MMMFGLLLLACPRTAPEPVAPAWPPKTSLPSDVEVVFIAEEALGGAPPGPVYVTDKEMEKSEKAAFIKMVGRYPFRGLRHDDGDWTEVEVEMLHATLEANGHALEGELPAD